MTTHDARTLIARIEELSGNLDHARQECRALRAAMHQPASTRLLDAAKMLHTARKPSETAHAWREFDDRHGEWVNVGCPDAEVAG